MLKPSFEAKYYEDIRELHITVKEPVGAGGDLIDYEILKKVGSPLSQKQWQTEAILSDGERDYEMEHLEPLVMYAITVRERSWPNVYGPMADPLEFEVIHPALSVPQNVKLEAIDSHRIRMTWSPPTRTYGRILGYNIEWSLDGRWQAPIHVASTQVYNFTKLNPGQTVSASVCARNQPNVAVQFEYFGALSKVETESTPPREGGMNKPSFKAIYYGDDRELQLLMHEPKGLQGDFVGYEVLTKSGPDTKKQKWHSQIVLEEAEREYGMKDLKPSVPYVVTVRGRVFPDKASVIADPLEFTVLPSESSVPRNVHLRPLDSSTVLMTWEPPANPYGRISSYVIEWSRNNTWQKSIRVSSGQSHRFEGLEPGEHISASVCARSRPKTSVKFTYVGVQSEVKTVSTPLS
ncbi:Oncosphere antigen A [Taenia solium]